MSSSGTPRRARRSGLRRSLLIRLHDLGEHANHALDQGKGVFLGCFRRQAEQLLQAPQNIRGRSRWGVSGRHRILFAGKSCQHQVGVVHQPGSVQPDDLFGALQEAERWAQAVAIGQSPH